MALTGLGIRRRVRHQTLVGLRWLADQLRDTEVIADTEAVVDAVVTPEVAVPPEAVAPEVAGDLRESIADGLKRRPEWPALLKVKAWLEL